jgi:hypothetical protein
MNIVLGENQSIAPVSVTLIPLAPGTSVTPGAGSQFTSPENPATGGPTISEPVVNFPTGTGTSGLTIGVTALPNLDPGQWNQQVNPGQVELPVSPVFAATLSGATTVSSNNIPANAYIDIPTYMPLPVGLAVDVIVSQEPDTNLGGAYVVGTVISNNGVDSSVVRVSLREMLLALNRAGRAASGRDDLTFYFGVLSLLINPPQETLGDRTGGPTTNYNNCASNQQQLVTANAPLNRTISADLNIEGIPNAELAAPLLAQIQSAIEGGRAGNGSGVVLVPGFTFGTITTAQRRVNYVTNGPVNIRSNGVYQAIGNVTIEGGFNLTEFTVNAQNCTGGGGNT